MLLSSQLFTHDDMQGILHYRLEGEHTGGPALRTPTELPGHPAGVRLDKYDDFFDPPSDTPSLGSLMDEAENPHCCGGSVQAVLCETNFGPNVQIIEHLGNFGC